MNKRILELLGLLLVGDGVLTFVTPKRHCLLWEVGPQGCRDVLDEFARHPSTTRWIGATQALLGIWLASQQKPSFTKRMARG